MDKTTEVEYPIWLGSPGYEADTQRWFLVHEAGAETSHSPALSSSSSLPSASSWFGWSDFSNSSSSSSSSQLPVEKGCLSTENDPSFIRFKIELIRNLLQRWVIKAQEVTQVDLSNIQIYRLAEEYVKRKLWSEPQQSYFSREYNLSSLPLNPMTSHALEFFLRHGEIFPSLIDDRATNQESWRSNLRCEDEIKHVSNANFDSGTELLRVDAEAEAEAKHMLESAFNDYSSHLQEHGERVHPLVIQALKDYFKVVKGKWNPNAERVDHNRLEEEDWKDCKCEMAVRLSRALTLYYRSHKHLNEEENVHGAVVHWDILTLAGGLVERSEKELEHTNVDEIMICCT